MLVAIDDDVFFAELESVNEEEGTIKTFCILFFDEESLMFSRWIVEDFLWCEKPAYPRNLK